MFSKKEDIIVIGILVAKLKLFIRSPWTFIIFTGMSIFFAFIIGSSDMGRSTLYIPIHSESEAIQESIIGKELAQEEAYSFGWLSEKALREKVESGKAELGVILHENDFEVIVGVESPNKELVKQTVQAAYTKKLQHEHIMENLATNPNKDRIVEEYVELKQNPVFTMKSSSFHSDDTFVYDSALHSLFGFTLFFVIYTIAYNVLPILTEKQDGVWDRMILSPVKKWEMYVANLIYSFLTGYLQVVIIFLTFRFLIGVNFHGRFLETLLLLIPYVFSIVALSILITAMVKKAQQFNAVIPIISVSMAMIGGAYWPLEIVSSKVLLALSKINPITYGMEILNGATVYGLSMSDLLLPISILILMGVIMMGIGIHLMERRHV
jgi:ABC-2 type transport system permease protein